MASACSIDRFLQAVYPSGVTRHDASPLSELAAARKRALLF
jgi:hypothetical protein